MENTQVGGSRERAALHSSKTTLQQFKSHFLPAQNRLACPGAEDVVQLRLEVSTVEDVSDLCLPQEKAFLRASLMSLRKSTWKMGWNTA